MLLRYFSHRTSSRGHLQGRGCRQRLPPQCSRCSGHPGGGCPSGPPSPRTSSRGCLQGGRRRRRSSPQYLQCGGRLGGECASGAPPVQPHLAAFIGDGDAACHPPPNSYGVVVVRREDAPPVPFRPDLIAWPSSGRGMLAAAGRRMHLRHSPRRPLSRGFCPGGRRRVRSYP